MTFLFGVYVAGCLLLLVAGLVEQRSHHRRLLSIPERIVVNGIRGKSSITRLCAGALRGGGLRTVAKTTGTAARFVLPDGTEEPIHRKFGLANIVEQIGIVRRAAAWRPDALVIECMAVLPDLQEINERKLVLSTICVISNVREDHVEEMGPTLDDVARSLARSIPAGGICVTAELERLHILREEADRRGCRLVAVDPGLVRDEEMERFRWITFKENVAIALAVAQLCGVGRAEAMAGMVAARPDPGTIAVETYVTDRGRIAFANVFAANDPESTLMNIELLRNRRMIPAPLTMVVNCRPDRIARNGQMGALTGRVRPARIVLIGEQTHTARARVPRDLADRVVDLGGTLDLPALLDAVTIGPGGTGSVVAVGNIHGQGEVLLAQLRALPRPVPAEAGLMLAGTLAPQAATVALAIGLLFALVCYLTTNLSPGGMITPGWLALTLVDDAGKVALIVGVTVVTYLGVRVLQGVVILYGKRLFAAVMMLSVLLSTGLFLLVERDYPLLFVHETLGFIVPGLVAYQLVRQPPVPTVLATSAVSLASYGVLASGVVLGGGVGAVTRLSGLAARRAVMGGLAVVVGVTGIVVGAVRADAGAPAMADAPPSLAAAQASELRFLRRGAPARTTVVDAAGTVLATFTDGARTATVDGPPRTLAEPQFGGTPVTMRVWVRLLPEAWRAGAENEPWFRPWLQQSLGSTAPDVLALAADYLDGAPEERDAAGVRIRGDARFGPPGPLGGLPMENSDFLDYLGVAWTFADGEMGTPDPAHYGAVDCSGFIRLVYGYRSGYPLLATNEPGPGLPRRAWAMAEVGPGVTVLADTGTPPSNLGALQAGDLVFFDLDMAIDLRIDHVAIYLGRDDAGHHRFVSSRTRADGPTLGDLGGTSVLDDGELYARAFRGAKRL